MKSVREKRRKIRANTEENVTTILFLAALRPTAIKCRVGAAALLLRTLAVCESLEASIQTDSRPTLRPLQNPLKVKIPMHDTCVCYAPLRQSAIHSFLYQPEIIWPRTKEDDGTSALGGVKEPSSSWLYAEPRSLHAIHFYHGIYHFNYFSERCWKTD